MSKGKQPIPVEEKTEAELAFIIETINNCVALPDYIKSFIIRCIENALWFPDILQRKNMSMKRLKSMLFGSSYKKSNKSHLKNSDAPSIKENNGSQIINIDAIPSGVDLANANITTIDPDATDVSVKNPTISKEQGIPPTKGHGKMAHTAYKDYVESTLNIEGLKSGDLCPLNCGGKVYTFRPNIPKVLLRIVGQQMAEVHKIKVERLRCNLCHYLVQAQIPAWVGTEKYDASFKSMLVLLKYYVAIPLYRQENFQKMLDFPLPDSTQWDLIEQVAGFGYAVFNVFIKLAANGTLIYNDDTRAIILEVIKQIKAGTAGKRTGMYTSGFIAENAGRKIALFINGRQHSGENLADILKLREPEKPPITQMCDALSANIPKGFVTIVCNCLSHGFRKFDELVDFFPTECIHIMQMLGKVYEIDEQTRKFNLHLSSCTKESTSLFNRATNALRKGISFS